MPDEQRHTIRKIPTKDLVEKLVGCGNTSGRRVDKFKTFCLMPVCGAWVKAPLIAECYASLECRVVDTRMTATYSLFILEVLKAWVDPLQKHPETIHHLGRGLSMVAGETIKMPSKME